MTFAAWSALAPVMTDKRHELLNRLHDHPAPDIRALARDVGRDHKRVHADVSALEGIGLIECDEGGAPTPLATRSERRFPWEIARRESSPLRPGLERRRDFLQISGRRRIVDDHVQIDSSVDGEAGHLERRRSE